MPAVLFTALFLLVTLAVCSRLDRRDAARARRGRKDDDAAALRDALAFFREADERAARSRREMMEEVRRFMER